MELSLRRWKPGQLLLGWATYWVGLVGATMSPGILASWRATRLPEGHGSINASFDNGTLNYTVIEDGVKTWVGTTSFTSALLWIIVPPLLLWVAWLIVRERPGRTVLAESPVPSPQSPRALEGREIGALPQGSEPAEEWRARQNAPVGIEPGRVRTPHP
jgi:hypothetical protein